MQYKEILKNLLFGNDIVVILTAIHEKREYSLQHLAKPKDNNYLFTTQFMI